MLSYLLIASLVFLGLAYGDTSVVPFGLDPVKNFCSRIDHQSVVKNGILYIDGGTELFSYNVTAGNATKAIYQGYNTVLIAVNMSTSWNWDTNISETLIAKKPNPKTGTDPPLVVRGALYQGVANDPRIYLYGGTTSFANTSFPGYLPPTVDQYSLWSYDTSAPASGWNQYDVSLAAPLRPSSGAAAEAPNLGLGFYFNGEIDGGSSMETAFLGNGRQQFLDGMIVINSTTQTAKNVSTSALTINQPRTRGKMQYIPNFGPKGILVYLGGSSKGSTETDTTAIGNMINMTSVDIFDVASLYDGNNGTAWYTQIATGDIPDPRVDFCIVTASAPDNSSYNLYIYGGRNSTFFFDDIYVLSIPSFTWTKIYSGKSPRFGMTCHLVGKRQMITVGGQDGLNKDCDWELKSVAIYDLSTLNWGRVYDANAAPYTVPGLITATIGGNASGFATVTVPSAGFANTPLAHLFNSTFVKNVTVTIPTTTSTPSSDNSVTATATPPASSQPNVGAIAGGVVGGVVGLALIAGAVWFFLRRGRQQKAYEMSGEGKAQEQAMGTPHTPHNGVNEKDGTMRSPDFVGEMVGSGGGAELAGSGAGAELPVYPEYVELPSNEEYAHLHAGHPNVRHPPTDTNVVEMGPGEQK